MPIQEKDLGKYKRPGIFIEEIDDSIIDLPVQDVLINLVPGFSKKGPVNNPTLVSSKKDFTSIFGEIDKSLEKKGSYFHRTALKMLDNGPIYALNLLSTDDTRDTIEWKSISVGASYDNNPFDTMPYSRVFNRQDFWERSDESFLEYIQAEVPTDFQDRLLHLTNMGEKTITVFIYKSTITGFDVTAEEWYQGVTKVPSYIHPKDWISDYMVSVLIIQGDWSDYASLSVDPTWSNYFDATGLLKENIQDFVNEQNVTVLSYYDASLIPYFKDLNGRDMYIKSTINNNTNKTGLFCAYYEEYLQDSEYPTGRMDVIGDGLVGSEKSSIDFLSYQDSILDTKTYEQQELDDFNNVFGNYSYLLSEAYSGLSNSNRTA